MVQEKKIDVVIVPEEQKRWTEIKETSEKEISQMKRSILIHEKIIILADEMIESNKLKQ